LEADDVMLSFAEVEVEAGGSALLVTGDRDLFQVVGPNVAILELRKDGAPAEIGPAQVRERYGIGPDLVAAFIALRGDPSAGRPWDRGEDRARPARPPRLAGGSTRGRASFGYGGAPAGFGGAARARRPAACVQADCRAGANRGRAATGPPHGLRGRRAGGSE